MIKVIVWLVCTSAFVGFMIFFQNRLGALEIPFLMVGAATCFAAIKAVYDYMSDETKGSTRSRGATKVIFYLMVISGLAGFALHVIPKIVDLMR